MLKGAYSYDSPNNETEFSAKTAACFSSIKVSIDDLQVFKFSNKKFRWVLSLHFKNDRSQKPIFAL